MFAYGTYVLEGEVHAKFSLSDIWNLFQEDALQKTRKQFLQANDRLYEGVELPSKNKSSTEHRDYQAST